MKRQRRFSPPTRPATPSSFGVAMKDGWNELNGPYELIEVRNGVPIRYSSVSDSLPGPEEEREIIRRVEAATGFRVALAGPWEQSGTDPREAERSVRLK